MTISIEFRDLNNNVLYDPQEAGRYASGLQWSTRWPRGYVDARFQVKRNGVFSDWLIKESHTVIIRDGENIVFDGRINSLPINFGGDEYQLVQCDGWVAVLNQIMLRPRWWDIVPQKRFQWKDGDELSDRQTSWPVDYKDNVFELWAGGGDISRGAGNDYYEELYAMPAHSPAQKVERVSGSFYIRTGEGLQIRIRNNDTDTAIDEYPDPVPDQSAGASGTFDTGLISTPPNEISIRIYSTNADIYDDNDRVVITDWVFKAQYQTGHPNIASPSYTSGQLIKDVVLMLPTVLSVDLDKITEPGTTMTGYVVEDMTPAIDIIDEIAGYSDASFNTYGFSVWSREGTTDDKPKAFFEVMPVTTDHEYQVSSHADNVVSISMERTGDQLYNDITVKYINDRDRVIYRTSSENANYKNQTSIDNEYRRHYQITLGKATSAIADQVARRFLSHHKDRKWKGSIVLNGWIYGKDGGKRHLSQVRAGERVYLSDIDETFVIRQTTYSADDNVLTISPEIPGDQFLSAMQIRERKTRELEQRTAKKAD